MFVGAAIDIQENVSYVNLTIISNAQCTASYGSLIKVTLICTSGDGEKAPCSGDSGGPLAVDSDGTRILVSLSVHEYESPSMESQILPNLIFYKINVVYCI